MHFLNEITGGDVCYDYRLVVNERFVRGIHRLCVGNLRRPNSVLGSACVSTADSMLSELLSNINKGFVVYDIKKFPSKSTTVSTAFLGDDIVGLFAYHKPRFAVQTRKNIYDIVGYADSIQNRTSASYLVDAIIYIFIWNPKGLEATPLGAEGKCGPANGGFADD